MKDKISRFETNKLISRLISAGVWIMLVASIVLLAYLSFVKTFYFTPSIRSLTTVGLVSLILNVSLWESFYNYIYQKKIMEDIENKNYSVHKRYYAARLGWKYKDLQDCVRQYNRDFREAWLQDVVDITGRSIEEIRNGPYKHNTHKVLIWRIKHNKYPSTGIKTANSLLYVLSVGKSSSMKINVHESEIYHARSLVFKIITSLCASFLMASFGYEFIQGNYLSALLKFVIAIVLVLFTIFLGGRTGYRSAKTKLSTAEAICEKLEEWRNEIPTEVPYKEEIELNETEKEDENNNDKFVEIV